MNKRKRSQTHLSGTSRQARVETLTLRLQKDETWQRVFSPEEQSLCVEFAARYLRLQAKLGLDLEQAYGRILKMLLAASDYELAKADVATVTVEAVECRGDVFIDGEGREVMVRCGRHAQPVRI